MVVTLEQELTLTIILKRMGASEIVVAKMDLYVECASIGYAAHVFAIRNILCARVFMMPLK